MLIDKNVKAEDVKEKMMKSLDNMNEKYNFKDSTQLQQTNLDNTERKIRFGWK